MKDMLKLRCPTCGHEWEIERKKTAPMIGGRFLAACPQCAEKTRLHMEPKT